MRSNERESRKVGIALVLAGLACLWPAGCATPTSPPDAVTSSQDEDLGRLFEDLYRDVHEGRVRNGECTTGSNVRWCLARYEREDDFFGYERYAVITIDHSARTLAIATFRSEFPNEVQLLLCTAEPGASFADRIPEYLVQRYPRESWETFEADPIGVDPRQAAPPERIPARLHGHVRGVIFHSVDEIHMLLVDTQP